MSIVTYFLQHFLDLPDFVLDLAGKLLGLALGFQSGVVRHLSRFLFHFAFHHVKRALDLIFRARFQHLFTLRRNPCNQPSTPVRPMPCSATG